MKTTDHIIVLNSSGWVGIIHLTQEEQKLLEDLGEYEFIEKISGKYGFSTRSGCQWMITSNPDLHYFEDGKEVRD